MINNTHAPSSLPALSLIFLFFFFSSLFLAGGGGTDVVVACVAHSRQMVLRFRVGHAQLVLVHVPCALAQLGAAHLQSKNDRKEEEEEEEERT